MAGLNVALRKMRKEKRWTLLDVSRQCGISVPYLSDIERDITYPSYAIIINLAKCYGTTPEEMITGHLPEYAGLEEFVGSRETDIQVLHALIQIAHKRTDRPMSLYEWNAWYERVKELMK